MIALALSVVAVLLAGGGVYLVRKRPVVPPGAARTVTGAPGDPIVVVLGNDAVAQITPVADEHGTVADRRVARPDLGRRHTTFGPFPPDWTPSECVKALTHAWSFHSDAPPAWLEANSTAFADMAAAEFGCPVGCPDNWREAA